MQIISVESDMRSSYAAQRKLKVAVLTCNFVISRQVSSDIINRLVTDVLPEDR